MDNETRRAIIMDNYQYPNNKEVPIDKEKYIKVNSNNESCIDNLDIYIKVEDNKVIDIYFDGEACAISTSSASIMTKLLKNKSIREIKDLYKKFNNMIENGKNYEELEEALAYNEIYKQENRKHCALLPWLGIIKAIENSKK